MILRRTIGRIGLFFGAMAIVLLGGLTASYFAGRSALEATDRVLQFDSTIERVQDLRSAVQDAETGQRGYLLTHDENYLEPYEDSMAALLKQLEALRNLAGSGSLSQERVNELAVLIQQKSDELRKTVDLTKAGRVENALEVVRTGQGKG